MSTVYLEVDGKPVDAQNCHWIEVAPCGCVNGVTRAQFGGELITTAEQALNQFARNKVDAKRTSDDGFTHRLVTHEQFRTMGFADCQHDPKWGIEKIAPPEGWVWATPDGTFGRKTHTKHMVPDGSVPREGQKWPELDIAALCGKKISGFWNDDRWNDCVTCRKCEQAAKGGVA